MADTKISALAPAGTGAIALAGAQSGASVKLQNMITAGAPTSANDSGQGYGAGSLWFDTNAAALWACRSGASGAAVWVQLGAMDHPGYVSGLYYPAQHTSTTAGQAVAADTLYACPIFIAQRVSVAGLGIRINTGVASTAVKLGLYSNAAGRPGTLLAAGGSVSTVSANQDAYSAFASALTVDPGYYWIASIFNGAPAPATVGGADHLSCALIGTASMGNSGSAAVQVSGVTGSGATYAGGLPGSFGAATVATGNAGVPLGHIKIA